MSKTIRNIIIVIVVGLLVILGFRYLSGSQSSTSGTTSLTSVTSGSQAATLQVGVEFRDMLSKVQRITLDDSIFNDKAFDSLRDFSKPLAPAEVGRLNPFSPIGSDSIGPTNTLGQ
ncbi:MAG: hypothetical protein WCW14_04715 [Candidatus Paceibacterota bacterium]|jgi:hypothetical protein